MAKVLRKYLTVEFKSEYTSWKGAKLRCTNKNNKFFYNYGGRGITMCNRWLHSFDNFMKDMGPKPSPKHSLDRIDFNGHYCPENCRWATMSEQQNNKRTNVNIEINGVVKNISQWAKEYNLKKITVITRILREWNPIAAVTTPAKKYTWRNGSR